MKGEYMSPGISTADCEIAATRFLDATRERVFRMRADPGQVSRWWGPRGFTTTIIEMDVKPGGVWRFVMHGPDGTDYQNKIIYTEIAEPERLAYSHVSGPKFDAMATFDDLDGKTILTMRMRFESPELRDKVVQEFKAVDGLNQTLDRLEGCLR